MFHVKHLRSDPGALLREATLELGGLPLTDEQYETMLGLGDLLLQWSARMNLTGTRTMEAIVVKHLIDSLMASQFVERDQDVIDVGTGAGFPGLPLALAVPTARFTLLDASRRKTSFVEFAVACLGLQNVTCIRGRAEVVSRESQYARRYHVALARGIGRLGETLSVCRGFVSSGGSCIVFLKASGNEEVEAEEARSATGSGWDIGFCRSKVESGAWERRFLVARRTSEE